VHPGAVPAVPRGFEGHCLLTRRDRTRRLGREDSNLRIRNRARSGPTAIVRRKEWQQIARRLAASGEASGTQIPYAEVRILPPQAGSPVSIGRFATRIGRPLGHQQNVD
jgi:hypothetical protein